ncbi:unnamed protein product [Vicia faba]|uniref:Uncharacterized protein n=1 Tax=Vicia faba TaxID=3906 RepID=A0AAV1ARM1_VICFA|nr:unnamed protein product [Vicia faba]
MSRACHHHDGLVRITLGTGEVESYIVDIVKPSAIDFDNLDANEGIVLDARLLEDAYGLAKLFDIVLDNSVQEKLGHEGVHINKGDANVRSNVKQCLCKVAYGYFTTSVKVLGSSGVAPIMHAHTMKALEAKHPYKPPPSMATTLFSEAPLVVEVYIVLRCIKSFPKGTSCGRDGLQAQYLLDTMEKVLLCLDIS